MQRNDVEQFLGQLAGIRALVVGDLMLDEYMWGKTERISPEAPVQVVDVQRVDLRLGGAGNVVNNLVTLGCQVQVVSAVGDDDHGRTLCRLLEERQVSADGLVLMPERSTTRKTRILASNQQMLRIDREDRVPIDAKIEALLLTKIEERAAVDVIFVSDYLKGVLTESLLARIIALGKELKVPVAVDPKGADFDKYRGATVLTPNRKEAQIAAGVTFEGEADLLRVGHQLCRSLGLDGLVLTRSEEGMTLFLSGGQEVHLPTRAREVFDVSGAGDTVLAVLGAGLGAGLRMADAAALANLAAGVVVGKVGTSTVSPAEILEAAGQQHPEGEGKILPAESLRQRLDVERRRGRTIVFTNGCFDLLHVGHVKYLQKARKLGDLLVLGLNSDASIRRLKGPKRPLLGQEERAHILAALDCIDHLVIFDEDTPLELIETLKPDILVKGGDYAPEGVVGKDFVESYGGRVELIQFVDGKSTTNIIEKILQQYREE